VSLFFCASITLRGVSVVQPDPFSLDYVALWSANVLLCCSLILLVSLILVWVPVADGRAASKRLGATTTTMLVSEQLGVDARGGSNCVLLCR
jgi:hypothetical protein